MKTLIRKHLPVIVIAMVSGAVGASAPVIAHGVTHAQFAHEAGEAKKLGGKKPSAYMGSVAKLRLVGVATVDEDGTFEMKRGVIDEVEKLGTGQYRIHFSRPVRGLDGESTNLVIQVVGNDLNGDDCIWVYSGSDGSPPYDSFETRCHAPAGAAADSFHTVMVYEPRK